MRSNPIGHTIFFTREKYPTTNHKPDTIFFTCEENRIAFCRHFVSSYLSSVNSNTALLKDFKQVCQEKNSRFKETLPTANVKRPNIKNQSSTNATIVSMNFSKPCKCRPKTFWRIEIASVERWIKDHLLSTIFS